MIELEMGDSDLTDMAPAILHDGGVWVTEASSIGLAPGEWPQIVTVHWTPSSPQGMARAAEGFSLEESFRRSGHSAAAVIYSNGDREVHILND